MFLDEDVSCLSNIDVELKDLYRIPGYFSEYNNKMKGKAKGSGVGIYVKECFAYSRLEKLCKCTTNFELIFISVSNTDKPLTVGVLYRPPGGVESDAVKEFENILNEFPDKNVLLFCDFNFNLFERNASSSFENAVYSNHVISVISVATYEKPGCELTLIDNIITNSTDNLIAAGVLDSRVSHHLPIFCILDLSTPTENESQPQRAKFDTCETNINKSLEDISQFSDEKLEKNGKKFQKIC
jgi:hypothetical protein